MSSSTKEPDPYPTAVAANVDAERLHVVLADGRELSVPTGWFAWLARASDAERKDLEIVEGGQGIWWRRLDDGISVPSLFGLPHA
jgi:hypothetical protein